MLKAKKEFTEYWAADGLGEVQLLHARYLSQRFVPHTHEALTLGVILEGALGFEHHGRRKVAPAGTMSIVNPGEVHTGYGEGGEGWTYRNFFVGPDFLRRVMGELTGEERLPWFPQPTLDDPRLARDLLHLHRVLETDRSLLERQSLALCTFAGLVSTHAADRPRPRRTGRERAAVARARNLIEDRYADDLCLDDLSAAASLSPFHLIRVFRRQVGLTPHAYLLQVRVARARELLHAGRSIAEAALDCGFFDQSHLTRRFKQIWGVTPGRYAKDRKILQDRSP